MAGELTTRGLAMGRGIVSGQVIFLLIFTDANGTEYILTFTDTDSVEYIATGAF